VFHGALGYAVELGLLPANPIEKVQWHAPRAAVAINPVAVASPAQIWAILAQVMRTRPELAAFFGCLYYAPLRPEEAVALRREGLIPPAHGRGKLILAAACPRTGATWTGTGTPHEPRGLKHRADGAIRVVPIPPVLADMLRHHLRQFGTTPDRRLFRGNRGGMLSESVYGRAWHAARLAALSPELAVTSLARRPYDLRHVALSLSLNATSAPAEIAARAGSSARVLHEVYLHCIDSQDDDVSQRIEDALDEGTNSSQLPQCRKASGYAHRRHQAHPVRYMSMDNPRRPAPSPLTPARTETRNGTAYHPAGRLFPQLRRYHAAPRAAAAGSRTRPTHSPRGTADGLMNRSLSREKPVTQSCVTGFELGKRVAGVGFEPT
jgi:integrase